jgi:uncharacterized linocin/CFP29 family protein
MDLLKKELAPVTGAAWEEIGSCVKRALEVHLTARRLVDLKGPLGWDTAAVGIGRLGFPARNEVDGVRFGIHQVQPLLEARVSFELGIWDLDNIVRGARDVDLGPAEDAARRLAAFEDRALFLGLPPAQIRGMLESSSHKALNLDPTADGLLACVSEAMVLMREAGVAGPFAFVAGPRIYRLLGECLGGRPLKRLIQQLTEGPILYSPVLEGACVVSQRGGDLEMVLGQDISLGYETHDTRRVRLYLTESFTFRVLDGAAILVLKVARARRSRR